MGNRIVNLRFRLEDRDIFEAIKKNRKKFETRAATPNFSKIEKGDTLRLVCGKEIIEKKVVETEKFKTISGLLKKYKVKEINPLVESAEDLEKMYYSFPNYRKKIEKYGLIAFKLQ